LLDREPQVFEGRQQNGMRYYFNKKKKQRSKEERTYMLISHFSSFPFCRQEGSLIEPCQSHREA